MAITSNMELKLPTITDFYDIDVFNGNFEKIDEFFADLKSAMENHAKLNHVTGVKGDNETEYRTGNVNLTPANIGLGNVDNTADSEKRVLSATKLTTARSIDGVSFDGSSAIYHYAVCSTAGSTATKVVTKNDFSLAMGASITIRFSNTNTTSEPTLNINNTGAKPIFFGNRQAEPYDLVAGEEYKFTYNAQYSRYQVEGAVRNATSTIQGLMSAADKAKLDGYIMPTGSFSASAPGVIDNNGALVCSVQVPFALEDRTITLTVATIDGTNNYASFFTVVKNSFGFTIWTGDTNVKSWFTNKMVNIEFTIA